MQTLEIIRSDRPIRPIKLLCTFFLLTLFLSIGVSGCFLKKKKSDNGGGSSSSIIKKSSIFFDRIGDGDSARLKFNTKKSVFCRLEIYSQEDGVAPTKDKPRQVACQEVNESTKEFVEQISDLRTDTLYYVKIHLLKKPDSSKSIEKVTVKESGNASSAKDKSGKYKEIFVARLNQPLKTAEFHRHVFKTPAESSSIRNSITKKIGCKSSISSSASPYSKADKDFKLTNLATTNYGSGKARPHDNAPGRQRIAYKALNTGIDRWSFLYDHDGKDYEVKALPGNIIETIELKSTETLTFGDPKLEDGEASALSVSPGQTLSLEWETDRKLSTTVPSYVTLKIGTAGSSNSISCIFDAKAGRGEVPGNLVSGLSNGTYDVLTELETSQIWAKDGWLVTAYDWRSAQISVQ